MSFYDGVRHVASDAQLVEEPGSRIFGSTIKLAEPEFELFKRCRMTIRDGETVLASASLRLVNEER